MLKNKNIMIMGIRNKWSIAYGAAKMAAKAGANLIFTISKEENVEKIDALVKDLNCNYSIHLCDVSDEAYITKTFTEIKEKYNKIDGILHSIAHANTEDLRNDFINTSKSGFNHANDVSAFSLIAVARVAKELDLLNEKASIVTLTYLGAVRAINGYNIMGVSKAALEASVRYLAIDLGKVGMRINAVSAGPIKTLSAKGIKDFNKCLEVIETQSPLKRNVTIEEVGGTVAFLFSELSSGITGQTIYVDSGYSISSMN